jgi:hypothetical protein
MQIRATSHGLSIMELLGPILVALIFLSLCSLLTPNNTDIFDSTGAPTGVAGLLTSTTTTGREIQFALRIIW